MTTPGLSEYERRGCSAAGPFVAGCDVLSHSWKAPCCPFRTIPPYPGKATGPHARTPARSPTGREGKGPLRQMMVFKK